MKAPVLGLAVGGGEKEHGGVDGDERGPEGPLAEPERCLGREEQRAEERGEDLPAEAVGGEEPSARIRLCLNRTIMVGVKVSTLVRSPERDFWPLRAYKLDMVLIISKKIRPCRNGNVCMV